MSTHKDYKKYIIGSSFVKVTNYEAINTGRRKQNAVSQPRAQPMSIQELESAYRYRQRAKREKLVYLADVNFLAGASVFVTLTFRESISDYETAVKEFKRFTKRLRRTFIDLQYIATIEIQHRGAFHFHLLVNLKDVQMGLDSLAPCWQIGSVDIQAAADIKSLVLYMTKDFSKQDRNHLLFNKRCYFVSQGLIQCTEVTTWDGSVAQMQKVQGLLGGRNPDKRNSVNSTRAGQTVYEDFYFPTGYYPVPQTAKVREQPI